MMFHFGSRSGSYFALVLFGSLFALLGLVFAYQIRQRRPRLRPWKAAAAGLFLFFCPVILIYVSSLSGFYEADVLGGEIRLRYLLPASTETFALTEISAVDAQPAFKDRWRLHIRRSTGQRYQSATWRRASVEFAMQQLRALVAHPPR